MGCAASREKAIGQPDEKLRAPGKARMSPTVSIVLTCQTATERPVLNPHECSCLAMPSSASQLSGSTPNPSAALSNIGSMTLTCVQLHAMCPWPGSKSSKTEASTAQPAAQAIMQPAAQPLSPFVMQPARQPNMQPSPESSMQPAPKPVTQPDKLPASQPNAQADAESSNQAMSQAGPPLCEAADRKPGEQTDVQPGE